jgi:ribosomal protein L27
MDKILIEVIKKQRRKEKEETKKIRVPDSHNPTDRIAQRLVEKRYNANFNQACSTIVIRKVGDKFHHNFQAGFKTHL